MTNHIVDFTYCNSCVHKDKGENEDPCWDCLTVSSNEDSKRPISYKEAKKGKENDKEK